MEISLTPSLCKRLDPKSNNVGKTKFICISTLCTQCRKNQIHQYLYALHTFRNVNPFKSPHQVILNDDKFHYGNVHNINFYGNRLTDSEPIKSGKKSNNLTNKYINLIPTQLT